MIYTSFQIWAMEDWLVGCAILSYNKYKKFKPRLAKSMYLGPKYSNDKILKEIKK